MVNKSKSLEAIVAFVHKQFILTGLAQECNENECATLKSDWSFKEWEMCDSTKTVNINHVNSILTTERKSHYVRNTNFLYFFSLFLF